MGGKQNQNAFHVDNICAGRRLRAASRKEVTTYRGNQNQHERRGTSCTASSTSWPKNGYVILRDRPAPAIPPSEWESLTYMDWKSGGDTNFAPLASAFGEMECRGFWDHGKADKEGIWTSNRETRAQPRRLRRGDRLQLRPGSRHQAEPERRGNGPAPAYTWTTTTG